MRTKETWHNSARYLRESQETPASTQQKIIQLIFGINRNHHHLPLTSSSSLVEINSRGLKVADIWPSSFQLRFGIMLNKRTRILASVVGFLQYRLLFPMFFVAQSLWCICPLLSFELSMALSSPTKKLASHFLQDPINFCVCENESTFTYQVKKIAIYGKYKVISFLVPAKNFKKLLCSLHTPNLMQRLIQCCLNKSLWRRTFVWNVWDEKGTLRNFSSEGLFKMFSTSFERVVIHGWKSTSEFVKINPKAESNSSAYNAVVRHTVEGTAYTYLGILYIARHA